MAHGDIRIAKRYAKALFDAAQKAGALEEVERDLRAVMELMVSAPTLRGMWDSPLIPAGRKRTILSKVLGESLHPLTLSFLRLLIDKRREDVLDPVLFEMRLLADRARHLLRADATFAVDPTEEEATALQQSLHQRTGEEIELTVRVDPTILGGVIVRMQDTIIDGSVRGTLERLRDRLLQEA